jgi:hypothetical protein
MAFITKAFDLIYKRLGPTGSISQFVGYLPLDWYNKVTSVPRVSQSFLNFPDDTFTNTYITTRNTASNATYRAVPWGSTAGDFLWNVLTPSLSYNDVTNVHMGSTYQTRFWVNEFVSKSFNSQFQTNSTNLGVTITGSYAVTSSWKIVEPKLIDTTQFSYVFSIDGTPVANAYVGSSYNKTGTDKTDLVSYDISFPVLSAVATSSIDGAYFDQGGGAGITRAEIATSLTNEAAFQTNDTAAGLKIMTEALKARRLYFPVPVSGSGTPKGTDYWFKKSTGYKSSDLFTDNGGIYNVRFSLKRKINSDYYPDTNTYMTAFIHNVIPQIPSSSARIPGADGWYPPTNNIVTIGNQYNGGPEMTFVDIQTGYFVEKFNFNLIQYGYPAQLCLEVSGSLADSKYFGIIVDEFEMCKVGVTTDARFIKPTSIATTIIAIQEQGGGYTPPPGGG